MNAPLKVGSLFSGIGGFDLGFERAGMRTEWFVERESFCQAVLRKHWPTTPVFADVCSVHAANTCPRGGCADCLPGINLLCGGFPCQDLSVAGKGAGLDGARSGLWAEFHRLIGELRPRWVVVENVPVLRSRGLGRVLGEMADIGYDAEWNVISAADAGAPHLRKRIWIVAYPRSASRDTGAYGTGIAELGADADGERRVEHGELNGGTQDNSSDGRAFGPHADGLRSPMADPTGVGRQWRPDIEGAGRNAAKRRETLDHPSDSRASRSYMADADCITEQPADNAPSPVSREESREGTGGRGERGGGGGWSSPWAVEPDVGRVAHGIPARMDRLRALGNALVPQIAEWIGHRIMSYERSLA